MRITIHQCFQGESDYYLLGFCITYNDDYYGTFTASGWDNSWMPHKQNHTIIFSGEI